MTVYVVDTSVAVKWYFPELGTELAVKVLDPAHELHAPDLLRLEFDSVLVKRLRKREIRSGAADIIRAAVRELPLRWHQSEELRDAAFAIACETSVSVYDALFAALAVLLDAKLVTADRKLRAALAGTSLAGQVRTLDEVSEQA